MHLKGEKMETMDTYYIDGDFVDDAHAMVPAKDITVLRGYGVFDFLVTYNKRPFHLDAHVARLENSAKAIGLALNHSNKEIGEIVQETLKRNPHHQESNVRIVYTGGISPDGVTPQGNGILMVMVTPKYELPDLWYAEGAKIITVDMERFIPTSKSTNYLSAVFAQQKAHDQGAIEAIYKTKENHLLEGTTTNLFCFKGNTLITPPDNILPGITREVVLDLLKDRYDIQLRHIREDEMPEVDEVFITASNKEVVPVIQVDDLVINGGQPGEKTKDLLTTWADYTRAYGLGEVG